uniref:3-oxoacyl-[acyl-carrier-protein] reductase n=1 Tax=Syphacia muris TaxID=451379 RepID=A0A0N5AC93_9BILA
MTRITCSSNGIGRGTAELFARDGAKVTITGRDAKALQVTKDECLKAGAKNEDLLEILGDITHEEIQDKLINETLKKFGRLDVLVNNHGSVFSENDAEGNLMLDAFDKTFNLNCRSIVAMCIKTIPHLKKTKGCIVNTSSIASRMALGVSTSYAVSKAALDHLTRNLAIRLSKDGIRVNAVNPGLVKTAIFEKIGYSQEEFDKVWLNLTRTVPLGRCGIPKDIAEMITFLADNDKASFITGQTMVVDGGSVLLNPLTNADVPELKH